MSKSRPSQWAVNRTVNTVEAKHAPFFLFFRYGDTLWSLLVVLQQGSRNKHLL